MKYRPVEKEKVTESEERAAKRQVKRKNQKIEKRVKERQIKEVIDLVEKWRNFHDGKEKLNLDVAANKVKIARKTLDDYHLCLRRAKYYGFDFESNKYEKMGYLRKYIREQKEKQGSFPLDKTDDFSAHNLKGFSQSILSMPQKLDSSLRLTRNISQSEQMGNSQLMDNFRQQYPMGPGAYKKEEEQNEFQKNALHMSLTNMSNHNNNNSDYSNQVYYSQIPQLRKDASFERNYYNQMYQPVIHNEILKTQTMQGMGLGHSGNLSSQIQMHGLKQEPNKQLQQQQPQLAMNLYQGLQNLKHLPFPNNMISLYDSQRLQDSFQHLNLQRNNQSVSEYISNEKKLPADPIQLGNSGPLGQSGTFPPPMETAASKYADKL